MSMRVCLLADFIWIWVCSLACVRVHYSIQSCYFVHVHSLSAFWMIELTLFVSHPHSDFFPPLLLLSWYCVDSFIRSRFFWARTSHMLPQTHTICCETFQYTLNSRISAMTTHITTHRKKNNNKNMITEIERESKKTYAHFRTRMVDENNFRLFTIQ